MKSVSYRTLPAPQHTYLLQSLGPCHGFECGYTIKLRPQPRVPRHCSGFSLHDREPSPTMLDPWTACGLSLSGSRTWVGGKSCVPYNLTSFENGDLGSRSKTRRMIKQDSGLDECAISWQSRVTAADDAQPARKHNCEDRGNPFEFAGSSALQHHCLKTALESWAGRQVEHLCD